MLFTQESMAEKNNTLMTIMIIIVLAGAIYTIATTDSLRGVIISLVLILVSAVIVSVGMD